MQLNLTQILNPNLNRVKDRDVSLDVSHKEDSAIMVDSQEFLLSLPQNIYDSIKKVERMKEEFIRFMEFVPHDIELVHLLYDDIISDEDMENYKEYGIPYFSIDRPLGDDIHAEETYESLVEDDTYEREDFNDKIYESLNLLNKYDRTLLMQAFGLGEYDEHTMEELSAMYHKDIEEDYKAALDHFKHHIETML